MTSRARAWTRAWTLQPDQKVMKARVLSAPKSLNKLCALWILFRSVEDAEIESSEIITSMPKPPSPRLAVGVITGRYYILYFTSNAVLASLLCARRQCMPGMHSHFLARKTKIGHGQVSWLLSAWIRYSVNSLRPWPRRLRITQWHIWSGFGQDKLWSPCSQEGWGSNWL